MSIPFRDLVACRCARPLRMPCEPWRCEPPWGEPWVEPWNLVVGRIFVVRWVSFRVLVSVSKSQGAHQAEGETTGRHDVHGSRRGFSSDFSCSFASFWCANLYPTYSISNTIENKQKWKMSQAISRDLKSSDFTTFNKHIEKIETMFPEIQNDHKQPAMAKRQGPQWHRSFR